MGQPCASRRFSRAVALSAAHHGEARLSLMPVVEGREPSAGTSSSRLQACCER